MWTLEESTLDAFKREREREMTRRLEDERVFGAAGARPACPPTVTRFRFRFEM